jgi:hypothetical protein
MDKAGKNENKGGKFDIGDLEKRARIAELRATEVEALVRYYTAQAKLKALKEK